MTLALIAGRGDLPPALVARLPERPLVCALLGFDPAITPDVTFRLEQLGTFLKGLKARGVTQICMAGAIRRPSISPDLIDAETQPLVPRIMAALDTGDDEALRSVIAIIEDAGFEVIAAHDIAPDLLPPAGVLTHTQPADRHRADARAGESCIAELGHADQGQACIISAGRIVTTEDSDGTDAMIARFRDPSTDVERNDNPLFAAASFLGDMVLGAADMISGRKDDAPPATDGILFKAPKPGQDRRADLPVIGPVTAMRAAEAGLAGIVIEADGVMVMELTAVRQVLDAQGMFLWVRPRGDG